MKIGIASRQSLIDLRATGRCFSHIALIEIASGEEGFYEEEGTLYAKYLKMEFAEGEPFTSPYDMTIDHAQEIARFINALYADIDTIIIACYWGQYRGPAIAAALLLYLGGDDWPIWKDPGYEPSEHCYRLMTKALGLKGAQASKKKKANYDAIIKEIYREKEPRRIFSSIEEFHACIEKEIEEETKNYEMKWFEVNGRKAHESW